MLMSISVDQPSIERRTGSNLSAYERRLLNFNNNHQNALLLMYHKHDSWLLKAVLLCNINPSNYHTNAQDVTIVIFVFGIQLHGGHTRFIKDNT